MTTKTFEEEEAVRIAAYYMWLAEGQPEGRHELHWERARGALTPPQEEAPKPVRRARKPSAAPTEKVAKKAPAKAKKAPAATAEAAPAKKPRARKPASS